MSATWRDDLRYFTERLAQEYDWPTEKGYEQAAAYIAKKAAEAKKALEEAEAQAEGAAEEPVEGGEKKE